MSRQLVSGPVEEAAEWLATLSDSQCTLEERRAFANWLKRSTVNVEEFLAISTLTRRLETSAQWPRLDPRQLIAEALSGEKKIATLTISPAVRQGKPRASRWPLALAAMVLVAVAASFVFTDPAGWFGARTFATRFGELRSVTLPDGSIVQLDAQSSIRERFSGHERAVDLLSGSAIFKVAGDARRPFRVSTGSARIVAVGTAFNVSMRRERTVVTVLEGRVRVDGSRDDAAGPVELDPGQQVVIEPGKPIARPAAVDPVKVTAWTGRRLYFEDTPLGEAVEEFARYSARTIRIQDPLLAGKRITGTFDAADPAALIAFLQHYTDANIRSSGQGWAVSSAEK